LATEGTDGTTDLPLVAVSYPVDEEFERINREVLGGDARIRFLQQLPREDWPAALAEADILLAWNLPREVPVELLAAAKSLRFIQLLSAGVDHVDFWEIPDRVVVAGNVGAYAQPMAEHAMALALALAKRLPQHHAELARGVFDQETPSLTLDESICGILGFGGIGKATARLMRPFGARIFAVNTSGRTDEPVEFVGKLGDLDAILGQLDVVIVALPLTRATRGLIGRPRLELMKPTAILVNVARGAIIDEGALYEHLRANPQFCAGIDAWWQEPFGDGHFGSNYPFFELPNLVGSPHNSAIVPGILYRAARQAAANARRFLRGEPVAGVARREDYG
jgi:phosphoglycerate dehydrogenase-like enzyme